MSDKHQNIPTWNERSLISLAWSIDRMKVLMEENEERNQIGIKPREQENRLIKIKCIIGKSERG